jgi:uncharacterized membrane protein YciS (DUF1049 family)
MIKNNLIVISLVLVFFAISFYSRKTKDIKYNLETTTQQYQIDSLQKINNQIDSINSQLIVKISNEKTKIDTIKVYYEKKRNKIDTLSLNDLAIEFQRVFADNSIK